MSVKVRSASKGRRRPSGDGARRLPPDGRREKDRSASGGRVIAPLPDGRVGDMLIAIDDGGASVGGEEGRVAGRSAASGARSAANSEALGP
eukprot:scaffold292700_cov30-Tisochrysis_lutea.AAC.2